MSTSNTARRARLELVVAELAETQAIERILRTRLRERRERRGAMARRQVHHTEEERWTDIAGALKIQNTDNPADLVAALASGKVQHRFVHPSRWWVWKPVPPRLWKEGAISGNKLIGPNGSSLENEHQKLVINKRHWREHLSKPAATASSADVPPSATEIRKESNAGAPPQYDWDEASQYIEKLWEDLGDPRDPLNAKDGWKSDYDIARSVVDHLEELYPDQEPPLAKTVADKLRPKIKRLRGD
jgi:hypothetical protein